MKLELLRWWYGCLSWESEETSRVVKWVLLVWSDLMSLGLWVELGGCEER